MQIAFIRHVHIYYLFFSIHLQQFVHKNNPKCLINHISICYKGNHISFSDLIIRQLNRKTKIQGLYINYKLVMSTNSQNFHHPQTSRNKPIKFQRTGSPVYRIDKSSSSSEAGSLSRFYVKLSSPQFNQKLKNKQIEQIQNKSECLNHKCSIKSKRLKFVTNEKQLAKVRKKLTHDNPKQIQRNIKHDDSGIQKLTQQNIKLKQRIQILQKSLDDLTLQLRQKNHSIFQLQKQKNSLRLPEISNYKSNPARKLKQSFTKIGPPISPRQFALTQNDEKKYYQIQNSFDELISTQVSAIRSPNDHGEVESFPQIHCCRKMSQDLYQAKQQISRLQIIHNFELRKFNKEFEIYKTHKQKEIKILKDKLNQVLTKFKEACKKAASLEIKFLMSKKQQAVNQSFIESIKDFQSFYALSSDDQK